uniref:Uncharacterized protein n=1 Tax=Plectus sambesii TaxID=2011161 RepID=A0A914VS26_9BILA
MATRGSIVTIFTDSAASDLFAQDALNSLLEKAVEKDIQINAVLTDHGCQCMCIDFDTASTVNPSSDVFQALRRLTRLTQGSLTEMDKTQKGYNAAVELVV